MPGFHLLSEVASDAELTARWQSKDPEHYRHIRTLGERAKLDDQTIDGLQEGYAEQFSRFGAFISKPDQVPGYRRVVKLDPGWQLSPGSPLNVLLAVDHDGRMSGRVMADLDDGHPSVMDMLELGEPWGGSLGEPSTLGDLNRYAKGYRDMPLRLASSFRGGMVRAASAGALPKSFTGTVHGMILRRMQTAHRIAAWALLDALDPDMRRHMRSVHQVNVEAALWLSGNSKPAEPAKARLLARNRLQACRAYPLMSERFICGEMSEAIDHGLPLAPAIEERLQVSRDEVRLLQGLSWQKLGLGFRVETSQIVQAIRAASIVGGLSRENSRNLWRIQTVAAKFALSKDEVLTKIRSASDGNGKIDWEKIAKLTDAADMVEYLADKLYVPAALIGLRARLEGRAGQSGQSADRAAGPSGTVWKHVSIAPETLVIENHAHREAFRTMSLKDLLAASDRWHRSLPAHDSRIVKLRTGVRWKGLLPEIACGNAMVGRELISSDALSLQGQMEGHCVGGYDGHVVNSSDRRITLIYSIERNGEIAGTLELGSQRQEVSPGGAARHVFGISQLRGKRNSQVPAEVEDAAERIRTALNALEPEDVTAYLQELGHARHQRQGQTALMKDLAAAKYDFWDRSQLEAAWSELSHYLPRAIRKAGLDAMIEACGAELERNNAALEISRTHKSGPDGVFSVTDAEAKIHRIGVLPFWETHQAQIASLLEGSPGPEIMSRHQLRGLLDSLERNDARQDAEKEDEDFCMDEVPF